MMVVKVTERDFETIIEALTFRMHSTPSASHAEEIAELLHTLGLQVEERISQLEKALAEVQRHK